MGKFQIPETSDQWTDKLSSENGEISDPRKQNDFFQTKNWGNVTQKKLSFTTDGRT